MKRLLFFCSLLVFAGRTASAEPKWIHVLSSDFEIFSTANENSTMEVLQHFEDVRSFFSRSAGRNNSANPPEPVRVIVFGSDKEFRPYRPSEAASAFYAPVAGRDYIVLRGVSKDVFRIAVHEYVHLIARHEQMNLPVWMNEGLADTYSTLKPQGRKILIGTLIPDRVDELLQSQWIPLATVLAADQSSPLYNEKKKVGSFYAESWAFVHMLMLSPEYAPQFAKLAAQLSDGGESQQVVEALYGKPLAAFDKEVQTYIRSSRLTGVLLDAKLDGHVDAHPEPAQPFDVKLALLDLLDKPGKEDERRGRLSELAAAYPQRPEPHAALGYLDARTSQSAEAMKEFKTALDLGGKNPQMLWDYGRMAISKNSAEALRALQLLLTLEPGRGDVRLLTGEVQLWVNQSKEAIATLSQMKKVTPDDAPALFRTLAVAQMNENQIDDAKAAGQRWLDYAKEPVDREKAARFLTDLESRPPR